MSNSSMWPIDRTLSGAKTLGQSGPGGDGNEGVFDIPQSFSNIRASPTNFVESKELDCDIIETVFEVCLYFYVYFPVNPHEKCMNPLISPNWRLKSTITVLILGWLWL